MSSSMPLVTVDHLSVAFTGNRKAQALSDISFTLHSGEVLGLLGESGSGKSVTLRTLLRLHPEKTTRVTGRIEVHGQEVLSLNQRELQAYRGATTSMIFQEPGLAFDPVYTIGQQIVEMILAHEPVSASDARQRALEMLDRVQIPQAKRRFDAYPHELSGGMRQRAMIALALACKPKLLLADEPTTALDATVQIQILLLLRELQKETGMAVIFVTHDIGAAVEIADRIAVMYGGRIVEENSVSNIVQHARHPYTAGLLGATVDSSHRGKPLMSIPGSPPNLADLPSGCPFAPRCSSATDHCLNDSPPVESLAHASDASPARLACWHPIQ